jgi:hypothetical protein
VGTAICLSVLKQGEKVTEQGEKVTELGEKVTALGEKVTEQGEKMTEQGEKMTELAVVVSNLKSRVDNVGYFVLGLVSLVAFGSSVTTILTYLDERAEKAEIKVEKLKVRDRKTQRILTSDARLDLGERTAE